MARGHEVGRFADDEARCRHHDRLGWGRLPLHEPMQEPGVILADVALGGEGRKTPQAAGEEMLGAHRANARKVWDDARPPRRAKVLQAAEPDSDATKIPALVSPGWQSAHEVSLCS